MFRKPNCELVLLHPCVVHAQQSNLWRSFFFARAAPQRVAHHLLHSAVFSHAKVTRASARKCCLFGGVQPISAFCASPQGLYLNTLFLQLWNSLRPETKLESRISKQWTEIGFQGDDPMTDFRGMGMLGLQNLVWEFLFISCNTVGSLFSLLLSRSFIKMFHQFVSEKHWWQVLRRGSFEFRFQSDRYFVKHFAAAAQRLLSHSNHPQLGWVKFLNDSDKRNRFTPFVLFSLNPHILSFTGIRSQLEVLT